MSKRILAVLMAALASIALTASSASAQFGLEDLSVRSEAQGGGTAVEAGSHPFTLTTELSVRTEVDPGSGKVVPVEEAKDLLISFPQGLVGNPYAVPQCPTPVFLAGKKGECADGSAVGVAEVEFGEPGKTIRVPVYNLEPTYGTVAKVGFIVEDRAPVTIDLRLNPNSPHNVVANATNVSQAIFFFRAKVAIWGNPADPSHDAERGNCLAAGGSCPAGLPEIVPFLTLPASCDAPLAFHFKADSWQSPGSWIEEKAAVGEPGPPLAPTDCAGVEFKPEITAQPTTAQGSSASGLDFAINVDDPGLTDPEGRADATIRKAVVTLPEGMTLNPSAADGLGSCSQVDFERETLATGPTCPSASKVGEVEVETPLLENRIQRGSIYVATPFENPFGTLISIYMVIREPELGILVKLPGKVVADPVTGRLTTTFGEAPYTIPQVPFSDFRFHFRSGPRAPLTTPANCGAHTVHAVFTPSSGNGPLARAASFNIASGPGGTPCPASALPFSPGFMAGSANSTAGAYSPFYMRMTRGDGQQEITSFSSILPPGLTGKIAGVPQCSQAAVDGARARSGRVELSLPSCPLSSRIGRITSGAGVGSQLTYVQGALYLGGPHNGSPLSVAAIVPAVAGPFDLGTVVVQQGLDLNPTTGEVEVKGHGSPIPRILAGVPLQLRDLRVYVDRPNFTLNPTDCEPTGTRALMLGSQNASAALLAPYQASNCAALKFKPKLSLKLSGRMKRGGNPSVTSVLTTRPGDANLDAATVILPPTQFIDNANINNPCTRVQFNADACPRSSILGKARAFTPLLDQPLEGPVYFRSNGGERELPDIVADLRGQFRVILVGFIDSKKSRIRTRFLQVPDAPVSKFVLRLAGGKRGLLENRRNLCLKAPKATLRLKGQNGRRLTINKAIGTSCKKNKKKRSGKRKR
jgi:hypothetical protein